MHSTLQTGPHGSSTGVCCPPRAEHPLSEEATEHAPRSPSWFAKGALAFADHLDDQPVFLQRVFRILDNCLAVRQDSTSCVNTPRLKAADQ